MPLEIGAGGRRGFTLDPPIVPAAGFLGYGRAYPGVLDVKLFGALVTSPTSLHAAGPERAAFARLPGGFILPTPANPGLAAVLREFAPSWLRWETPVVLALVARDGYEAAEVGTRLEHEETVSGIELQVAPDADEQGLRDVLSALRAACDLPVLVRLPLVRLQALAPLAADEGAAALVVGGPHHGAEPQGRVRGPVYGPASFAYTIEALRSLGPDCSLPLVASGGVYTVADARACLAEGAIAVQLDGVIPLDPTGAAAIARALR